MELGTVITIIAIVAVIAYQRGKDNAVKPTKDELAQMTDEEWWRATGKSVDKRSQSDLGHIRSVREERDAAEAIRQAAYETRALIEDAGDEHSDASYRAAMVELAAKEAREERSFQRAERERRAKIRASDPNEHWGPVRECPNPACRALPPPSLIHYGTPEAYFASQQAVYDRGARVHDQAVKGRAAQEPD